MTIKDRIERLRRETGWSQKEIAAKLNVSRQMITNLKSGKSGLSGAKYDLLRDLEQAAGIPHVNTTVNETPATYLSQQDRCPHCAVHLSEIAHLKSALKSREDDLAYTRSKLDQAMAALVAQKTGGINAHSDT